MSTRRTQADRGWARIDRMKPDPDAPGRWLCRRCGMDTVRVAAGLFRDRHKIMISPVLHDAMVAWGLTPDRILFGRLWDADHIVEVVRGGGECGMDNIQTLCWRCHRLKTAAMRKALAAERKTKAAGGGEEGKK